MIDALPLVRIESLPFPELPFDARLPEYRRETFIRLYGFHVDYLNTADNDYQLHWLRKRYDLSKGQRAWLGWIGAMTCDHITSWEIFQQFPLPDEVDTDLFEQWINDHASILPYGVDRRYYKSAARTLGVMLRGIKREMNGRSWEELVDSLSTANAEESFSRVYEFLSRVKYHGRLIPFTMSERFWNLGFPLEPSTLDVYHAGSKPFRAGLMLALGRNDLDQRKISPPDIQALHRDKGFLKACEVELYRLYAECVARYPGKQHSLFHFETCLCTYKGWWRGRRYFSCYNDMMWSDLQKRKKTLSEQNYEMFCRIRAEKLPDALRCELEEGHAGYTKRRATWFTQTGELVNFGKFFTDVKDNYRENID